LDEVRQALGAWGKVVPQAVLEALCGKTARAFAERIVAFDEVVGRQGVVTASKRFLPRTIHDTVTRGGHCVPRTGPLLVVANHPGLFDSIAILASMPRHDLLLLAKDQRYWSLLPGLSGSLIRLQPDAAGSRTALRNSLRHLSSGGALLLFPGGEIEADPVHFPGASQLIDRWSRSPEWLVGQMEKVSVLPVAVGGVLSPRALRHPVARLRCHQTKRRWLAATRQFVWQANQDVVIHVSFGTPLSFHRSAGTADAGRVRQRIHAAVRQQLDALSLLFPDGDARVSVEQQAGIWSGVQPDLLSDRGGTFDRGEGFQAAIAHQDGHQGLPPE
jgi:1-acyl-sn-glycerol-3-phosphate acyltransferase